MPEVIVTQTPVPVVAPVVSQIPEPSVAAGPELDMPQLTEVETQAYKEGWRPKDEYEGPSDRWVPADEFIKRKPLFEKIDTLKNETYNVRNELRETKRTLTALVEHHKKVRENEYKRAVDELKSMRRRAMEDDDFASVEVIDARIEEQQKQQAEEEKKAAVEVAVQQQAPQGPSAEYITWVKDNAWYNSDKRMHNYADSVGKEYLQENPQAPAAAVFSYVTDEVRKMFPDKFKPAQAQRTSPKQSPVDSGVTESSPVSRDGFKLSPMEEEVAKRFEQAGVMTRKEYAEELKRMGGR